MKSTIVKAAFVLVLTGVVSGAPELIGAGSVAFAGCKWCKRSRGGCSCRGRCPCHKGGRSSSRGGTRGTVKLKPVAWKSLSSALSSAKSSDKAVVLVFATEGLRSAATFNRASSTKHAEATRKALSESGALPVKYLPPKVPSTRGMDGDSARAALKTYQEAMKKYRATAKKYGATLYPTMVFLAPEGDVMGRLYCPNAQTVHQTLKALPAAIKHHRERKAKLAAAKAKQEAATAAKASSSENTATK